MRTFPSLLALALVLAACTSPVVPTMAPTTPTPTGTGAVRVVLHPLIPASRAVLVPDPTFVTVRLIDSATGRVQFGTGHNDGTGNYALTNLGALVPGRWTIRAFLYDDDTTLSLLYSGGQEITVVAGDNPVTLPVAAPGSLAGITVALANRPTGVTVLWQNLNLVPTTVPSQFRAGQTARLVTTVDGEVPLSLALDQRVVWSTSNPTLATVSPAGAVVFKASGVVTLTAKAAADETVVTDQTIQVVPTLFGHWKPVFVATEAPRALQSVPHPLVIEGQGTTDATFSLVVTSTDQRLRGPVLGSGAAATWRPIESYDYAAAQWKPLTGLQLTYGGFMASPNPVVTLDGVYQYLLEPWDDYQPVTSITLSPPGVLTDLTTPVPLDITGTVPATPSVGVFAFTSSNPNAVSVNPTGLMTLHTGAGSATVRVTALAEPTVFAEVSVSHGQITVAPPGVDQVVVDTSGLPWNGVFGLTSGPSTFTYHATSSGTATSWAWILDGVVVATTGQGTTSQYSLDVRTPTLALGPHTLSVEATAGGLVVTNDQAGNSLNFTVANTVTVPLASVSAGGGHTMLLKTDGTLWATGFNGPGNGGDGALGDGTTTSRTTFVPVLTGVASVSAGDGSTLALKTDGSLWATGFNGSGELGDGTTTSRTTFGPVLTGVASVSAGAGYTLAVKTDGSLWSVGNNAFGQLGDGTTVNRHSFVMVMPSGVASVAAGYASTLVVKTDGSLWAVGNNSYGQFGDGTFSDSLTFRQAVGSGVAAVASVGEATVILKVDGSVWTAGFGGYGSLGDGTSNDRNTFVKVMTGAASVAANADNDQVMVVKNDGSLWATGDNGYGALGLGSTTTQFTLVPVLTGVASVAPGNRWTMAIKTDGSLWATGNNAGAFGDGTTVGTSSFKRVM